MAKRSSASGATVRRNKKNKQVHQRKQEEQQNDPVQDDKQSQLTPSPEYKASKVIKCHTAAVASVKFSSDGRLLASASADGTVCLIDPHEGILRRTLAAVEKKEDQKKTHNSGLSDVCWSHDSRYLCTASDNRLCEIWDVESGKSLRKLYGHTNYVMCCNYNGSSTLLASGSYDESVRLWDPRIGTAHKVIPAHGDPVSSVSFHPDGRSILSSSFDGVARLFSTHSGECMYSMFEEGNDPVGHARFAPSGNAILTSDLCSKLKLWDFQTKKVIQRYGGHTNNKYCINSEISYTHGHKYVVSGSEDNRVYIWALRNNGIVQVLTGHRDTVLTVACNSKYNIIASGASQTDSTVRLWKPADQEET